MQDAFNPNAYRGPSDFDSRHTVTADAVVEIPVGKGKHFLSNIPGWMNQIVGGWQATTLISFYSGTPLNITDSGVYNVNYEYSAFAILNPGSKLPANGFTFDQNGNPSIFANSNAVNSFVGQYPGTVGTRGILRGPHFINTDLAVSKSFRLPWENQGVALRVEAFNAFNHVNFGTPSLSLATPSTFGEITSYAGSGPNQAGPRVMQIALRYNF